MLVAVLSGFAGSLIAPFFHRITRQFSGWIIALLPIGLVVYFSSFLNAVRGGQTFSVVYPWVPGLNVNLSFYLDGLSLLFVLLITVIGAFIIIYAGKYLAGHEYLGRFYTYILMFMASMIGLVMSNNVISLFVFWELTSLTSYLLIGFEHERQEARSAALQAFLVTGTGGLVLLAGLVLLSFVGGSAELSELALQGDLVRAHPLYLPILLLILVGAFSKSAQVPFHFWLPNAMEAPSPVSAYLHSATMVKAGVYLLARMFVIVGGTQVWFYLVAGIGALTMITAAYLSLTSTDLKRMLAYSTISALGTLVLLLGLGTSGAVKAAMVFLLAHALYKGALFMVAGIIQHETGTRDIDLLGGLRKPMPVTFIIAGLAGFSLAGIIPMFSFIGKELLLEAVLESPTWSILFSGAAVITGAVSVAVAIIITVNIFFGSLKPTPVHPHEAPLGLWLGPGLMALAGLAIGIFPVFLSRMIISPAVSAVYGQPQEVVLALFHGFNLALGLSLVSILMGWVLYRVWKLIRNASSRVGALIKWGPAWLYTASLDWLNRFAQLQTRILQNGYLRFYLYMIIATAVILIGYTLVTRGVLTILEPQLEIRFYEFTVAVIILLAAVVAARARSRLAAVAALGVVGYGVALVFILFGAPDLAMTQFMIETLTVILLVLVFYHLPRLGRFTNKPTRFVDLLISITVGALVTIFLLVTNSIHFYDPISTFFVEQGLPLAHGRNIVNLILVDFRAFDTLGEITVLALAGVGVFALLKLRLEKGG